MEPLRIEKTKDTPFVCFDKGSNRFEISGASLPANIFEFYNPVLDWLNEYCESPNDESNLKLKFEYLNSSSTKMMLNILQVFDKIMQKGFKIIVNWYYELGDEEMKEMGDEFASSCDLPFNFIHSSKEE